MASRHLPSADRADRSDLAGHAQLLPLMAILAVLAAGLVLERWVALTTGGGPPNVAYAAGLD